MEQGKLLSVQYDLLEELKAAQPVCVRREVQQLQLWMCASLLI